MTRHSRDARMTLQPGFADPVAQAQSCFRALLAAMARPGSLHEVGVSPAPPPLAAATAAVLLTLVDAESPLWLDGAAADAWAGWPFTAERCAPSRARPLSCARSPCRRSPASTPASMPGRRRAPPWCCRCRRLGTGTGYRLAGPGLREASVLRVEGLPDDFTAQWAANGALFPRGVDLILCAGTQLCALPRTTCIEEA